MLLLRRQPRVAKRALGGCQLAPGLLRGHELQTRVFGDRDRELARHATAANRHPDGVSRPPPLDDLVEARRTAHRDPVDREELVIAIESGRVDGCILERRLGHPRAGGAGFQRHRTNPRTARILFPQNQAGAREQRRVVDDLPPLNEPVEETRRQTRDRLTPRRGHSRRS